MAVMLSLPTRFKAWAKMASQSALGSSLWEQARDCKSSSFSSPCAPSVVRMMRSLERSCSPAVGRSGWLRSRGRLRRKVSMRAASSSVPVLKKREMVRLLASRSAAEGVWSSFLKMLARV